MLGVGTGPAVVGTDTVMGTRVTIQSPDPSMCTDDADAVFALLHDYDRRFSPFRDDSEVSLLPDEPDLGTVSDDLREILTLCELVRIQSQGAFDIRGHRADHHPDPTGLVKGWAVDRAAQLLLDRGFRDFSIEAGGDIVCMGEAMPGQPWRIGIRHPLEHSLVAAVVGLRDLAIATSGTYERGAHLIDPHSGAPATALLSMSVVGPSLGLADAYATAAFVMGDAGPRWMGTILGYECFAATLDGRAVWTPALTSLLLPTEIG